VIPRRALLWLLCLPFGLGLVAIYDPSVLWVMLAADAAVVLFAGLDAVAGLRPRLLIRRDAPGVFSLGRPNRVRLEVVNTGRRTLEALVTDDVRVPGVVRGLPAQCRLGPRETCHLEYVVEPDRRGSHSLGDHFVRVSTPAGLWDRQLRVRAEQRLRVYPDLARLRAFDLLAREERQYSLLRAVRRRGGETEFERLRDYSRDDEYRSIDWKATARKQRLIAREYQLESNQSLLFMLDAGRLMSAVVDGLSRLDHALNAALMLAHVATRGGDRVGLIGFDDQVRSFVAPVGGPGASRQLVRASYDLEARLVEPDFDLAFATLAARVRQRTLLVLFTHVQGDASAARIARRVRAASRQHLPLVVLFRDLDVERLLWDTGDDTDETAYARGAAAEVTRWHESFVRQLEQAGAHVLNLGPRRLTTSVIDRYLEIKARQLL
jgi:uncharacterized protein (DUF58 family)